MALYKPLASKDLKNIGEIHPVRFFPPLERVCKFNIAMDHSSFSSILQWITFRSVQYGNGSLFVQNSNGHKLQFFPNLAVFTGMRYVCFLLGNQLHTISYLDGTLDPFTPLLETNESKILDSQVV